MSSMPLAAKHRAQDPKENRQYQGLIQTCVQAKNTLDQLPKAQITPSTANGLPAILDFIPSLLSLKQQINAAHTEQVSPHGRNKQSQSKIDSLNEQLTQLQKEFQALLNQHIESLKMRLYLSLVTSEKSTEKSTLIKQYAEYYTLQEAFLSLQAKEEELANLYGEFYKQDTHFIKTYLDKMHEILEGKLWPKPNAND